MDVNSLALHTVVHMRVVHDPCTRLRRYNSLAMVTVDISHAVQQLLGTIRLMATPLTCLNRLNIIVANMNGMLANDEVINTSTCSGVTPRRVE